MQTDCVSAFLVDRVKIFLTCSLITVQNLLVLSHTVYTHVGGPKILVEAGAPPPWDEGMPVHLETHYWPMCVIIPNFVSLCQTVCTQVGASQKVLETLGPCPSGRGRGWYHRNTLLLTCYYTMFCHSLSNCLYTGKGVPKIWGCWVPPA